MTSNYPYFVEEKKYCAICENEVPSFLPWQDSKSSEFLRQFEIVGSDAQNFSCPVCMCHDRERHLYLYMKTLGLLEGLKGKKVLAIAPEMNFLKKIFRPDINFICGDLHPELYANHFSPVLKIDLQKLEFRDNEIDVVFANHVLEHIKHYKVALNEIYRVLKPGGYAVLQTPFSPVLSDHFEDDMIDSDELRIKFYGQNDHERIFGMRLFDDISAAGLQLSIYRHDEALADFDSQVYGVNKRESLILARKM